MIIVFQKKFEKAFKRLPPKVKEKFNERLTIFSQDEFNPILNNHALKGKYLGYRSINIAGDLRVVFTKKGKDAIFVTVDTHSNLYS